MVDETPDRDRAQDRMGKRKAERAETAESILEDVERHLGEIEYPVTGEELSAEYSTAQLDLPNETESLGSAFDRLANEEFDSAAQAREAIYGEITGEAGDVHEANPERELGRLDEEKAGSLSESGADET